MVNLSCLHEMRDRNQLEYESLSNDEMTDDRRLEGIVFGKVDVHAISAGLVRRTMLEREFAQRFVQNSTERMTGLTGPFILTFH